MYSVLLFHLGDLPLKAQIFQSEVCRLLRGALYKDNSLIKSVLQISPGFPVQLIAFLLKLFCPCLHPAFRWVAPDLLIVAPSAARADGQASGCKGVSGESAFLPTFGQTSSLVSRFGGFGR